MSHPTIFLSSLLINLSNQECSLATENFWPSSVRKTYQTHTIQKKRGLFCFFILSCCLCSSSLFLWGSSIIGTLQKRSKFSIIKKSNYGLFRISAVNYFLQSHRVANVFDSRFPCPHSASPPLRVVYCVTASLKISSTTFRWTFSNKTVTHAHNSTSAQQPPSREESAGEESSRTLHRSLSKCCAQQKSLSPPAMFKAARCPKTNGKTERERKRDIERGGAEMR